MALAKQFGFEDYAQPAGGCCFLTDKQYSVKLADLWATRGTREYDLDDIMLLKVGRHLRPRPNFKIIAVFQIFADFLQNGLFGIQMYLVIQGNGEGIQQKAHLSITPEGEFGGIRCQ